VIVNTLTSELRLKTGGDLEDGDVRRRGIPEVEGYRGETEWRKRVQELGRTTAMYRQQTSSLSTGTAKVTATVTQVVAVKVTTAVKAIIVGK